MSGDLRHRDDDAGAIDPEGDDFVAQFDRAFGPPTTTAVIDDAPPAPTDAPPAPPDASADVAGDGTQPSSGPQPAERGRSLPARIGMRIIRRPYQWLRRPWPDDRVVRLAAHRVDARRHDVHHDARRPLPPDPRRRPDLRRRHSDRRRHGLARLGAGLPPRSPAVELPAQRVEHGLVRRAARLPLLHGHPGPGDRRPRHVPALRGGLQTRGHLRPRHAAVHVLGLRPAGALPLPVAGTVRLRRSVLRPQREHDDLRGQRAGDDGRRVLVLDRHQPDDARTRPARPGPRRRQGPADDVGVDRPRPGVPQPRHRADLHGDRRAGDRHLSMRRRPLAAARQPHQPAPCRRRWRPGPRVHRAGHAGPRRPGRAAHPGLRPIARTGGPGLAPRDRRHDRPLHPLRLELAAQPTVRQAAPVRRRRSAASPCCSRPSGSGRSCSTTTT